MSRKVEANRAVIEDVAILARKAYPKDAELETRRQAARHRVGTTGQIFWTAVATTVQELGLRDELTKANLGVNV